METRTGSDLESIYREHGPRLWRSIALSTGDADVASDAVAEAFAQAIRGGSAIRDPLAWVWRAGFRIAAAEMKRRRSTAYRLPVDVPEPPADSLLDLLGALSSLPARQRAAIVLADYAGHPHREVARILGTTTGAVGVLVHRARRRLRDMLEERDV